MANDPLRGANVRPQDAAINIAEKLRNEPSEVLLSIAKIAEMVGCSRQTLWRDSRFKQAYEAAKSVRTNRGSRLARLEQRVIQLQRENERLLLGFVLVASRIRAKGIDPQEVMAELVPNSDSG